MHECACKECLIDVGPKKIPLGPHALHCCMERFAQMSPQPAVAVKPGREELEKDISKTTSSCSDILSY